MSLEHSTWKKLINNNVQLKHKNRCYYYHYFNWNLFNKNRIIIYVYNKVTTTNRILIRLVVENMPCNYFRFNKSKMNLLSILTF